MPGPFSFWAGWRMETKKSVRVASGYVVGHRARVQMEGEGEVGVVREWVVPGVLVGMGVVGRAVELGVMGPAHGGAGVGVRMGFAVGGIVIAAVALVAGVLSTAWVMGSEMEGAGAMGRKLLGLAAVAAMVGVLCASIDKDPRQLRGALLAVHVVFLIYFVGLCYLLRMDLLEGLMGTVIAVGVQVMLFLAVGMAVPAEVGRLIYYGG